MDVKDEAREALITYSMTQFDMTREQLLAGIKDPEEAKAFDALVDVIVDVARRHARSTVVTELSKTVVLCQDDVSATRVRQQLAEWSTTSGGDAGVTEDAG